MSPIVVPVIAADGSKSTVTLPDPTVTGALYPGEPAPGPMSGFAIRWQDVYSSNDKDWTTTYAKAVSKSAGVPFIFTLPSDQVMADDGFLRPDSSNWYLQGLRGFGGQDGERCRIRVPALHGTFALQPGTTQYTHLRQNQSVFEGCWDVDFDSQFIDAAVVPVFHGFTFYKPGKPIVVKDSTFTGFNRGTSGTPPTETFAAQFGTNSDVSPTPKFIVARCDIDGRVSAILPQGGTKVGGVGITAQRSSDTTWYRVTSHDNAHGSGATLYQVNGFAAYGCAFYALAPGSVPLNCEEIDNVLLVDCRFEANAAVNITYSNYNAWVNSKLSGPADSKSFVVRWSGAADYKGGYPDGLFYYQNWAGSQISPAAEVSQNGGKPLKHVWVSSDNAHHLMNASSVERTAHRLAHPLHRTWHTPDPGHRSGMREPALV